MRFAVGVAVALAVAGCSKKADPVAKEAALAVAGLAAVPADAIAVVSVDATRVKGSPLVGRMVDEIARRSVGLREHWTRLAERCQASLGGDVRRVVVGLGPKGGAIQPIVIVVLGAIDEPRFSTCATALFGEGGGTVTSQQRDGRTLYRIDDAGRTIWFTYGQADTMILATSDAWLHAAVTAGPKVADDPTWQKLVGRADQAAPIWAAGPMPERLGGRLAKIAGAAIGSGPRQFVMSADPSTGARVELGAVMASPADATALDALVRDQLGNLVMFAQVVSLGPVVAKAQTSAAAEVFRVNAALTTAEVDAVLKVIDRLDTPAAPPQDAPP